MSLHKHLQVRIHDNVIQVWAIGSPNGTDPAIALPLEKEIRYLGLSDGTLLKIDDSDQLAIEASGGKSHVRTSEDIGEVAIEIYCEEGFSWVLYGKHLALRYCV